MNEQKICPECNEPIDCLLVEDRGKVDIVNYFEYGNLQRCFFCPKCNREIVPDELIEIKGEEL